MRRTLMRSTTIAAQWLEKSTNGRSVSKLEDWRRLGFQMLGWVAPEVAQRYALEWFLTPPPPALTPAKWPKLDGISADRFRLKWSSAVGGLEEATELEVALWGRGPAVYLVHGWGGRSTQW